MIAIPEVQKIPVEQLTTDGKNPNQLTKKQEEALKKNIEKYGFLVPVITNKELVIADGEHRWKIAREIGMTEIPVIALDVEEVDRRILRQVMNKLKGTHDDLLDRQEFQYILENEATDKFIELLGEEDKKLVQFYTHEDIPKITEEKPEYTMCPTCKGTGKVKK